jgi:peroxiredoxin
MGGCRKSSPQKSSPANKTATENAAKIQPLSDSLKEVISRRGMWNPISAKLYGSQVLDFKFQDITRKTHNLSDYRGKNILLVFWATWCVPCMEEVPHLKALREIMPEDKLAIIAISNEPVETVKAAAEKEKINYTVVSYWGVLPEPFGNVRAIPTTFFIRPDGTLKLVAEGTMQLGETKSIILAE